jgi:hypothetical protein
VIWAQRFRRPTKPFASAPSNRLVIYSRWPFKNGSASNLAK